MRQTLQHISSVLSSIYPPEEARDIAFWIIEETLGLSRSETILCREERPIPGLESILQRLLRHEPIQYIFGHTFWCGLDLLVNPSTLIPRPETAELISFTERLLSVYTTDPLVPLDQLDPSVSHTPFRVLDIGTGSGCIALALKAAHPEWEITGVDISEDAIDTARQNAIRNHLDVSFHPLDILHPEPEFAVGQSLNPQPYTINPQPYSLIVSNPPYITLGERAAMSANVLDYEPDSALFVHDSDPLLFYRQIASLKWAPLLAFEINENLGSEMASMLASLGYQHIEIHQDSYGKDRFATAHL